MPWKWLCELCDQYVDSAGPWCDLYCSQDSICRPRLKKQLRDADATGDGPMVDAVCAYGRKRYGMDMDW
jgi:hypothetical protein